MACSPAGVCVEVHSCSTDKECKNLGLVCDKMKGICVECVGALDCPEDKYCLDKVCVPDVCTAGEALCDGNLVVTCSEAGSGWDEGTPCGADKYCELGKCLDMVCDPLESWCEGESLFACNEYGSKLDEIDCSLQGLHCLAGACVANLCEPSTIFCLDELTLSNCAEDGMSHTDEPCPAGQYCSGAECHPWVCTPGQPQCDGNVVLTCSDSGSGLVGPGTDCTLAGQCCEAGACVPKADEVCDGKDNDCNGAVDEGVLSPCGDCNPACKATEVGPGGTEEFAPGDNSSYGFDPDPAGLSVALGDFHPDSVWISNSSENTVSRILAAGAKEVGRYAACSNPSRTAVDLHGNVWVACRNDGGVMKIAGSAEFCTDKNGNGTLDTAYDKNGDGKINGSEVLPKGQDECVMFIVYPGGSCQRSAGVDRHNYAWVGEWNGSDLRRLEPDSGAVVKSIKLTANPYGLVIDQQGIIWVSGRGGNALLRVDPALGETNKYPSTGIGCLQPYGITVDHLGKVWIGNCCCLHVAYRYDPLTGQWASVAVSSRPRGIASSVSGVVYVANDESNRVAAIDVNALKLLGNAELGSGRFPVGVAVDFNEFIWSVNQSSSTASRIDPATLKVDAEIPVGSGPYTYSDMSGYILHNYTAHGLKAYYAHTFGSEAGPVATFKTLTAKFALAGDDPGKVVLVGRTAPTTAGLAAAAWVTLLDASLAASLDVDLPGLVTPGKLLQIKAMIFPASAESIKLTSLAVTWVVN